MTESSPSAGKIVLVGGTGFTGRAVVHALLAHDFAGPGIVVATRNPTSPTAIGYQAKKVCVVHADCNEKSSLVSVFEGAAAVCLIVSQDAEDREKLACNVVDAAKSTGVPYVLVIVGTTAVDPSLEFGHQMADIDKAVKDSGVPYTILQLPVFTDNLLNHADSIKRSSRLMTPVGPKRQLATIAVSDCAEAAAVILNNPMPHQGFTYNLVGPSYTYTDVAEALTKTLGKPVGYAQVPFDEAQRQCEEKGWPAWQVKAMMEFYNAVEAGKGNLHDNDFQRVTGRHAMSVQDWIAASKPSFCAS